MHEMSKKVGGEDSIVLEIQSDIGGASTQCHYFVAKPRDDEEENARLVGANNPSSQQPLPHTQSRHPHIFIISDITRVGTSTAT